MWLVRRCIGCVKIRTWFQLLRCVSYVEFGGLRCVVLFVETALHVVTEIQPYFRNGKATVCRERDHIAAVALQAVQLVVWSNEHENIIVFSVDRADWRTWAVPALRLSSSRWPSPPRHWHSSSSSPPHTDDTPATSTYCRKRWVRNRNCPYQA